MFWPGPWIVRPIPNVTVELGTRVSEAINQENNGAGREDEIVRRAVTALGLSFVELISA